MGVVGGLGKGPQEMSSNEGLASTKPAWMVCLMVACPASPSSMSCWVTATGNAESGGVHGGVTFAGDRLWVFTR